MADEATAIITTGIFTLAGVLGGAAVAMISALWMARHNAERQDVQELRQERIRTYANFLQAIAALETSGSHITHVPGPEAGAELDKPRSNGAGPSDRAIHALSELELFAGDQVLAKARTLCRLTQKNYRLVCEGREGGVSTTGARAATTTAMQVELGIAQAADATPSANPELARRRLER